LKQEIKAVILTEGGNSIGFGHITRCTSLLQALEEENIDTRLLIYGDYTVSSVISNIRYKITDWINSPSEILLEGELIDILIIDSMIAPIACIKELIKLAKKTAIIDDSRRITLTKESAIIIDWTPFVEDNYDKKDNLDYLLGSKYISLRNDFWDIEDKIINKTPKEILVTMGGSDIRNISPKILSLILNSFGTKLNIKVIVGNGFNKETTRKLKRHNESNVSLILKPDANGMLSAFQIADIVISAGGQTIYELARVGTPTICVEIIDNQRGDIESWEQASFIDFAGPWNNNTTFTNIITLLKKLLNNKAERELKKNNGRKYVDGQGARRIIKHLIK
jgi:UDP-2,4-diacetamido-2,4,6-trideoxy-beta-L-altropyranose hydrolase